MDPKGDHSRGESSRTESSMLEVALQHPNAAVLLDNAQDFKGAIQGYWEACNLLQQVVMRSSGDEDKRKLDAIVS